MVDDGLAIQEIKASVTNILCYSFRNILIPAPNGRQIYTYINVR